MTAGTALDSTKLPLRIWFLAIYLISQDKTGLSSLALMRHLRTSHRTAWRVRHKLMVAMAERDALEAFAGNVQLDDAYLGGEHPGVLGRGSPNKVPLVAAVATSDAGHPMRVRLAPVGRFTRLAIARWAKANLLPGCEVRSDVLRCFASVIDAACAHPYVVVGQRKPRDLPQFTRVNTILGNLKTMIGGGYKAFKFNKHASHWLGAFAYRFNHRVNLQALLQCPIGNVAAPQRRHLRGSARFGARQRFLTNRDR